MFTRGSSVFGRLATPPTSVGFVRSRGCRAARGLAAVLAPKPPSSLTRNTGSPTDEFTGKGRMSFTSLRRLKRVWNPGTRERQRLVSFHRFFGHPASSPTPFRREPSKLETSQDSGGDMSGRANAPLLSATPRNVAFARKNPLIRVQRQDVRVGNRNGDRQTGSWPTNHVSDIILR